MSEFSSWQVFWGDEGLARGSVILGAAPCQAKLAGTPSPRQVTMVDSYDMLR